MMLKYEKIWSYILFLYLLFLYLFSEQVKILTTICGLLMLITILIYKKKIKILDTKSLILWCLYLGLGLIPTVLLGYSEISEAFKFIISIIIALPFGIIYLNKDLQINYILVLKRLLFIVLFGCFLQILMPHTLESFNKLRMSNVKFGWFYDFFNSGFIVGFSFQTAITGFYLTILTCIIFIEILYKKYNFLNTVILISAIIFLFLTGKRIFILLTVLNLMFIYIFYKRVNILKLIVLLVLLTVLILIFSKYTIIGQRLVMRFYSQDPTRGRIRIYTFLFKLYKSHPIIGTGLSSTLSLLPYAYNAHNIYLQILTETGLVGFIILIGYFFNNLYKLFKVSKYFLKIKKNINICAICFSIQFIFLIWGFTGNPLYDIYPFVVYMISVGIVNNMLFEIKRKGRIKWRKKIRYQ